MNVEEYLNDLLEENKKMVLENEKLNNIINNAIEHLKEHKPVCSTANMLNILLGDDTHE